MADDSIPLDSLRVWQPPDADNPSDDNEQLCNPSDAAVNVPFPRKAHLNTRIALWNGPLWKLQIDAIVNATNEAVNDTTGLSRKILDAAGKEIWTECSSVGPCRTGEAVVTRGCRLPAKKVIHTVGPRYNVKYHNAAEHALHMCYRSVLSAAVEQKLRSVAFPCLYSKRKGYPRDEAAHIAARTVRRFLEHYESDIDLVVFCVDALEDQLTYEALLPLYFPRNNEEVIRSVKILESRDLGDEFGEPIIAERKIRIGGLVSDWSNNHADEEHDLMEDDEDTAIQSFCEMSADPDVERLERLKKLQEERQRQLVKTQSSAEREVLTYQTALSKAQTEDFGDLKKLRFLYNAGVDHSGSPVIVYMASRLHVGDVDLDRVMLYIIQTMDAIVDRSYSVLYVHSETSDENQPTAAWLKRLFKTFSSKYQQNLRFFYIYEPTMWLKLLLLVAKGFVSSAFYKKMVYLASPTDLSNVASTLDLPQHLLPKKEPAASPPREDDNNNNDNAESSDTAGSAAPSLFSRGAVLFAHKRLIL